MLTRRELIMKSKYLFVLICILVFYATMLFAGDSNDIKMDKIRNVTDDMVKFTLYDTNSISLLKKSLKNGKNITKHNYDIQFFKKLSKNLAYKKGIPLRKGSYIGTIELKDGTKIYVLLSASSSFFEIIDDDGFYYFEGEAEKIWLEELIRIKNEYFFPNRQ